MDIRLRLAVAAVLTASPILPLSVRLAHLQVMQHDRLKSRAAEEFKRTSQELLPRADIVDRSGHTLAKSIPSWSCFVDKSLVKSARELADLLAPALASQPEEVLRKIKREERFAWLEKGMSFEQVSRLVETLEAAAKRAKDGWPKASVGIVAGQERVYPNEGLARGILGGVGADGRGIAGIELALDRQLTGVARRFEFIRDGSGHAIYKSAAGDDSAPPTLRLTLDRSVQYYCEEALQEAAAKFSMKGGMIAVQDPGSGEILALAQYPSAPLKSSLVQDSFEPGSTFKVVTALAAVAESLVPENESFFCENGRYEIAPRVVITDHEPEGALTLSGIIERSSNIGTAKVVDRVGATRFYRYSRALGFGGKTGISLPGETAGSLKPFSDLTKVTLAASSYGYGVGVSVLQLMGAYSAIANGGTLWEPSLIQDGRKPSRVRRVASEEAVAKVLGMLEAAVERGTGVAAQIPGYRVAGKTGTSRKLDPVSKAYSTARYTASFAGIVPVSRPQMTILIVIDEPKGQYYGAQVAAPIFAKLGRQLLALKGILPDRPVPPRIAYVPPKS